MILVYNPSLYELGNLIVTITFWHCQKYMLVEGLEVNLQVKYDFSTNKGRNKCNTFSVFNFDYKIHSLDYFHASRSSSISKSQLQGQVIENLIFTK